MPFLIFIGQQYFLIGEQGGFGPTILPGSGESTNLPDIVISTGSTVREGNHVFKRHTSYSAMAATGLPKQVAERGRKTLPVTELWIMDSRDTLRRDYTYNNFAIVPGGVGATLPVAIVTSLCRKGTRTEIDRQEIHGYSEFGQPTAIKSTGRPISTFTWGYDGDHLCSSATGDDQESRLLTSYEWQPLTGCTGITYPSGRKRTFTYRGGRLSSVGNTGNQTLEEYDYSIHSAHGENRITKSVFGNSETSVTANTHYFIDGFGNTAAIVNEAFGGSLEGRI